MKPSAIKSAGRSLKSKPPAAAQNRSMTKWFGSFARKPLPHLLTKKINRSIVSLANQIYLRDDIIIISIDKNDLEEIVFKKSNLLECISRKIDAVKLNATKDLIALGLYNA